MSIMATKAKSTCSSCGKFKTKTSDPRNVKSVEKFLKQKSKEAKMQKNDRLTGGHSYLDYTKKKGSPRSETECCAGKGHRGRLRRRKKCCTIL